MVPAGGDRGEIATPTSPTIRVLHVDDEPGFAETAAAMLERADERLSVDPETSATAVLDRLETGDYECLVSDYDMPALDGLALLERVREAHPALPVVLFTGKGSEEIASRAIAAGVTDYLQKSSDVEQYEVLANRVTNAVGARRAAQQSKRDRRAMEAAWDGIATLDRDGRFTYANTAYGETFGWDPAELVGEPWQVLYPEDARTVVDEEILPAVEETGTWTGENVLRRRDGETFVGEHTVASVADGSFVCVVRDRTARREVDRALEYERERFRLLVQAVEEYAMFVLDTDGRVVSWNAGAERIKGYTEEEILGEHFSVFYTPAERETGVPSKMLDRARKTGQARAEGERVRADGSTFWADVTITPLYERDELRGYAKVTRDISARHERERRRQRNERYRKRLYEMTSDPDRPLPAMVTGVLALGVDYLGVEHGHLVAIDPGTDRHEIVAVSGDHPDVEAGASTPLSETYCRRTIEAGEMLVVADAEADGWADDPAYERFGLGCYVGAKIEIGTELFGTICFVDREPREPFREDEKAFVELLTRWLTTELQRHEGAFDWPLRPEQ